MWHLRQVHCCQFEYWESHNRNGNAKMGWWDNLSLADFLWREKDLCVLEDHHYWIRRDWRTGNINIDWLLEYHWASCRECSCRKGIQIWTLQYHLYLGYSRVRRGVLQSKIHSLRWVKCEGTSRQQNFYSNYINHYHFRRVYNSNTDNGRHSLKEKDLGTEKEQRHIQVI